MYYTLFNFLCRKEENHTRNLIIMFGGSKPPQSVGVDRVDLQARLYAQPDVLSPNKPLALKVIRRPKPNQGQPLPKQKLEPLPALSAYQRKKSEELLKTSPQKKQEKDSRELKLTRKEGALEPLPKTPPLPELPTDLVKQQRTLSSRRIVPFPLSPTQSRKSRSSIRRSTQSALYLTTDPDKVITKYFPPLEILDNPLDIIDRLRKEPELGFLYLTPVNDTTHYNPYNLRSVKMFKSEGFF